MAVRSKMSRENRAKQFMPFAALKGFEEALREKEKIVVPRIELSEESKEALDRTIQEIQCGDMVRTVYFCKEEYLEMTGLVSRVDKDAGILKMVNTRIPFADIYKLEKLMQQEGGIDNG